MGLWFLKVFSGVALYVFVGLHLMAHHPGGDLLDYEGVVAYISQPRAFILETLFLLTVLVHSMLGVRAIILDLGLQPAQERKVNLFVFLLGAVLFVYAFILTFSVAFL